jgi:asparagine synthase (glutamine-hydrolysing)
MFAFAIWDEKEQLLFCARDRFGEKPFHYCLDNNTFVFGSEIKQLWAYGIPKKIIQARLVSFIEKGEVDNMKDPCQTFYEDIRRLDAAHYMLVKPSGEVGIARYWDIDLQKATFNGTIENAAEQFLELFKTSVQIRLRSDVALGTSLSGGLDSSSIYMIIDGLKREGQKQTSFSARFRDFDKDEGRHIETLIKASKNVEAHYTWPDENYFLENFKRISFHQDEPYGSGSIAAQFGVMQLAKEKNVTVLIDGQGADEYLAGYLPYYKMYLDQLFYYNKPYFRKEKNSFNNLHLQTSPYVSIEETEKLSMKIGRYKRKLFRQAMPFSSNSFKEKLYEATTSAELKVLLRYADRNSMAHSREVRLPFLDHKLVEFVFTLPDQYKLNAGFTKFVLRKAMDTILPNSICWRTDKIGYEPPQDKWLKHPGVMIETEKAVKHIKERLQISKTRALDGWRTLVADYYMS